MKSKTIGTYRPPPSHGQIAAHLAGHSAATGRVSVMGGPQGYGGIGVPVFNNGNVSASVGAFSTFGKNMPKGTGAGLGFRFNF